MKNKGFTLVELLIVIAIIGILVAIVLYSATEYINKSRDATIKGRIVVLITAGELWYDRNDSEYTGFCSSNAVTRAFEETPSVDEYCNETSSAWAACAKLFVNPDKAYCVDNKGNQKEIDNTDCTVDILNCVL